MKFAVGVVVAVLLLAVLYVVSPARSYEEPCVWSRPVGDVTFPPDFEPSCPHYNR